MIAAQTTAPRDGGAVVRAPLEPDAPGARDLLSDELSDPRYAEALPNWFDLLSQRVLDWFLSLFDRGVAGPPGLGLVVVLLIIAALIAVAVAVYGVPARRRRSELTEELFGARDRRTARELRRDAASAASRGDWAAAIADRFRAIARALDERTIVSVHPGTTGHGFAVMAGRAFPDQAPALAEAATTFDGVRYLGRSGDEAQYRAVADLDETLAASPSPVGRAR
ncbi:DUF4129 domain-containing protein [Microcella sp.]|uniref:DUF4129 domain-containing protein n=1 Tax=Microcella sp. TaxID=1913979 RepID=UPI00391E0514